MPDRYSFSGSTSSKPWFRVGNIDVNTSVLVAGLATLSMVVWAISARLLAPLALIADDVRRGQIWRLVTWPIVNVPDFWTLISIAIFWYFGTQLENMLSRNRFAVFLAILTVVPALVATLIGLNVAGINYLELGIFAVFIAEYPFARFFFNIPGWVIGAVIIGLQVLQLLAYRQWDELIFLAVMLVTAAVAARSYGLASALPWLPTLPLPLADTSSRRRAGVKTRSAKRRKNKGSTSTSKVVPGPWTAPPPPGAGPNATDAGGNAQAELDALLDKISAGGLDSLTGDEKRRLNELSKRLR